MEAKSEGNGPSLYLQWSIVKLLGGSGETLQLTVELQPSTRTAVICSPTSGAEIYRAFVAEGL